MNNQLQRAERKTPQPLALATVCVYCGSGHGRNPAYKAAAETLGKHLAQQDIALVYGGGGLGLMGAVAKAALTQGGHVTGIMPHFLSEREQQLSGISELIVVDNMHQRKMIMFERSDAFVALPGGIGTLEELVEQATWLQLGRHRKPIVLANIEGFWDPLLSLLNQMREETFIRDGMEVDILVVNRAEDILPSLRSIGSQAEDKWLPQLDVIDKF